MEERTLLLLRTLQTAERTEAGLAGMRAILAEERPGLRKRDDRATLADASELLEVWSEAAPPAVAAGALWMAADLAEHELQQLERAVQLYQRCLELAPLQLATLDALQRGLTGAGRAVEFEPMLAAHVERLGTVEGLDPELLAQQLRRLGALRDAASDLAGAISAYERAVEHSADPELVRELAEAYARRNAPGDGGQAADLFTMLAEVLGPPESTPLIERALDLAPGNLAALNALESATPEAERTARLMTRWERFVASADDEEAIDARRPALARAYLAAGRDKDALACIGPLVDRGDAAAAELQSECLAALRAHEGATTEQSAEGATRGDVPREATLVGFRLPRSSSTPPEAGADDEPLPSGAVAKPGSGVHKRPAPRSGGTLVGFRLSEETLAALKAQEAAEASMKARAHVDAANEAAAAAPSSKSASKRPSESKATKPQLEAEAEAKVDANAKVEAKAKVDVKAKAEAAPSSEATDAQPATRPSAAPPALSPAEHAAQLRRSSSGSVPAPAMPDDVSSARKEPTSTPAPAARAPLSTPAPAARAPASTPAPAARARVSTPAPAPRTAPIATAARPRAAHVAPARPSSAPGARPSGAPPLSPAELAQSLRSGSPSTPPPARSSGAELAASAAAQHATALRRSSSGSIPAPAPRASMPPASASPSHVSGSSVATQQPTAAAAAASAHAAALRRSSSGGFAAGAATAMTLPVEESVISAAPPVLSAVAAPAPQPLSLPMNEPGADYGSHSEPGSADAMHAATAQHDADAAHEDASQHADAAGGYAEVASSELAAAGPEAAEAAYAATHEGGADFDHGQAGAVAPSVPPSAFGVAPSPVPDLAGALGAEPARGGSRKLLVIGAIALAGIGAAFALFGSSKSAPATPPTPPAPVAEATPTNAAPPTAVAAPTTATPPTTAAAAPAGAGTTPAAAAAPGTAPTGLPGDLAAAVAAPTTGTPTGTTGTGAAAAAPTQDEKVLGKVELAGVAKIKGGGKLRPKDVADAVREQFPALERCYTETLEDKPGSAGGLTFGFTVAKNGKATAVKKLSGTIKDAALARCATKALGEVQFDKPKKPIKVTLPLRFQKR